MLLSARAQAPMDYGQVGADEEREVGRQAGWLEDTKRWRKAGREQEVGLETERKRARGEGGGRCRAQESGERVCVW